MIMNLDNNEINISIWNIIDKYKENYPIFKQYYKKENSITQLFEIFNNNDIFCFKYNSIEGCSLCTPSINKTLYLNCIISYDINYLKLFSIEQLIYYNLKNDTYTCPNCGYNHNEKIKEPNVKNYYKTIVNVQCPKFIFIGFELSNEYDLYNEKGELNSINQINFLCYKRMEDNLSIILEKIVQKFTVYNLNYYLKGIVCSPFSGHFSGMIIDLDYEYKNLQKTNNYYYDDLKNNNEKIETNNYKDILNENLPLILIYKKE